MKSGQGCELPARSKNKATSLGSSEYFACDQIWFPGPSCLRNTGGNLRPYLHLLGEARRLGVRGICQGDENFALTQLDSRHLRQSSRGVL
jgi:hypothetical protein